MNIVLLLSLQSAFYLFFLPGCPSPSSMMLNRNGESGLPRLVQDQRGKTLSLNIKYNVSYRFFVYPLSHWGNSHLFLLSWELLLWMDDRFDQMIFLHSLSDLESLFFKAIDGKLYFQRLNQVSIPGINLPWSWCVIFFIYCWILFAKIMLLIIMSVSCEILVCSFLLVSFFTPFMLE